MRLQLRTCFARPGFSGTLGGASFDTGSANSQAGVSGNVQHGQGSLLFYGNFSGRRTGDYDAPDETIPNSATQLGTGEGGFGWNGSRAYFGHCRRVWSATGTAFLSRDYWRAIWNPEIDLKLKRQNVRFDTGMQNLGGRFADAFRIKSSYLDYQHDELDIDNGVE